MLKCAAAVVMLAFVLGGCTDADWDNALSYGGIGPQTSAPAPVPNTAPPPSGLPPVDDFCNGAAKAAAQESRDLGFDEATQRRQAEAQRKQCLLH